MIRLILKAALGLLGVALLLFGSASCVYSAPPYRGPISDHFDGANLHLVEAAGGLLAVPGDEGHRGPFGE